MLIQLDLVRLFQLLSSSLLHDKQLKKIYNSTDEQLGCFHFLVVTMGTGCFSLCLSPLTI